MVFVSGEILHINYISNLREYTYETRRENTYENTKMKDHANLKMPNTLSCFLEEVVKAVYVLRSQD